MAGFLLFPQLGEADPEIRATQSLGWGRCFPARTAMVNTSEGRPPLHQTQMKLFNAIAAAAVIGSTALISGAPANAYTQTCMSDGLGGYTCFGDNGTTNIMNDGLGGYTINNYNTNTNCYMTPDYLGGFSTICY